MASFSVSPISRGWSHYEATIGVPRSIPPGPQECFLDDVFGSRSVAGDAVGNRKAHCSVVLVQPIKRPEIAARKASHRVPVGPVGRGPGAAARRDLGLAHRSVRTPAVVGSIKPLQPVPTAASVASLSGKSVSIRE